jgi:hypothetical protein
MTKRRVSTVDVMAEILAETVAELSDDKAVRHTLAFAGYTDNAINRHINNARNKARHRRLTEIEMRMRKELRRS